MAQRLTTAFVGRRLTCLPSATSTQDEARAQADAGAPEGTAVLAEEQTAGRGRLGRSWASPAGTNLYLTIVLRPTVERLRSLSIVAPLAVAEAVEETTGLSPGIKWPNDVLIRGRKLAGILIENELAGRSVRYSLVGIGLNVNLDVARVPEIAGIATSLRRELGREVSRGDVLAALLNRFEALYLQAPEGPAVLDAWRSRLETLGRQVRATFGRQVEEGLAEDVDAEGSLILRRPDGSRVSIAAGEVTLR
ncbi:MAG: biotin--[acetyl-CoA-carboxylase] ligase [Chloroflexi bacterium]|nr:biotin--[acetyl-CoA-carboxylase] ligase [Chloroflexota bacterium]